MEIKKIKLIDFPKEEFSLNDTEMVNLMGGYYCSATYQDGGVFGTDICSATYNSSWHCGAANDYCGSYTNCTWNLG